MEAKMRQPPPYCILIALLILLGINPMLLGTVEAAKVLVEKPMVFSEDGGFVRYQAPEPATLESMRFVVIADYPSFLAGEVAEADLNHFRTAAEEAYYSYQIRPDYDRIQINGYTFPSIVENPPVPAELAIANYDGNFGLYLVQFKAPVTHAWFEQLRAVGNVLSYIPQNTFILRASPEAIARCLQIEGVQHLSIYQPAFKIQPALLERNDKVDLMFHLDGGQDLEGLRSILENLSSEQVQFRGAAAAPVTRLKMNRSELIQAAKRPEVLWIEPVLSPVFSGERDAMVVAGRHNGSRPNKPEDGGIHEGYHKWLIDKGFCTPTEAPSGCYVYWTKVGLVDSGLNTMVCPAGNYNPQTGICSSWASGKVDHPDYLHNSNLASACSGQSSACDDPVLQRFFCANGHNGVSQCLDQNGDYSFSDDYSHGSATGSIIAGIPSTPVPPPWEQDPAGYFRGTGIAPSAQLILAKFISNYFIGGVGAGGMSEIEYEDLTASILNADGRFSSNSWNLKDDWHDPNGSSTLPMTAYTGFSRKVDELVRDANGGYDDYSHPLTIVFSAGNEKDLGAFPWVMSPANAKNAIVVGASRGWSTTGSEGAAHTDCASQNHDIGDIHSNAIWQSDRMYIGEDNSGADLPRFKPDLVAPGTQFAAARAQDAESTDFYKCFSGTSAAAPAVTASAVLAEAWYYYVVDPEVLPSPAMIKAMLVAHADDMEGGKDWFSGAVLGHSPSPAQGWGRINLDKVFQTNTAITVFDEDHSSSPTRRFTAVGQSWTTSLSVDNPDKPILAVLVFTDAPSGLTATGGLMVNNLELRITKPGSFREQRNWVENQFPSDSWYSEEHGMFVPVGVTDEHNTVKVIRIEEGSLTTPFVLSVTARAINANAVPGLDGNEANQDFALYVYNAVSTS